ncbi:MAG: hypothetical protein FWF49_05995, partial [Oscillospiraceae bacterium]|nr:hypothetical protein [Oscillospiraceae bacterium]
MSRHLIEDTPDKAERALDRHGHPFRMGMLITGIALVGLCIAGMLCFWFFLADYETHSPQTIIRRITQAYRTDDGAALAGYITNLPATLQNPDALAAYLNENLDRSDIYNYEDTAAGATLVFHINAGAVPVATVTLQNTGLKSFFGFPIYQVSDVHALPLHTYILVAPAGAQVTLDGMPLDTSHPDSTQDMTAFADLDPAPFQTCTYIINEFTCLRDVQATGAAGAVYTAVWDGTGSTVTLSAQPDDTRMPAVQAFTQQFTEAYTRFSVLYKIPKSTVLPMVLHPSALYDNLNNYNNDWGNSYTTTAFDGVTMDDITAYSDHEYSCHISLQFVITRGSASKTYPLAATCYMSDRSGKWLMVA